MLLRICDRHALGFAPHIGYGERPEGDEIDSWHELDEEGRQEFPMPAEQFDHHGGYAQIQQIVGGRHRACDEGWEDSDLQNVGHNGQRHGSYKLRSRGNDNGIVRHLLILDDRPGARVAGYLCGFEGRYIAAPSFTAWGWDKT